MQRKKFENITLDNKYVESFTEADKGNDLYQKALKEALIKIKNNLEIFSNKYPHVSTDNVYTPEENKLWTASFFPGMAWLGYDVTGDKEYIQYSETYLDNFLNRLEHGHIQTHDLGFLYTLTCVSNYKLTENIKAKEIALKAADILMKRYNEKGKYIQAWNKFGEAPCKIIVDTMLNLPLLYWSAKETGNKVYYDVAYNHAMTSATYLVREDATSYHTYIMDHESGKALEGKTHQGYADESTWARGQAWVVYGFALSYAYTKEPYFLEVAQKAAIQFLNNTPKDYVAYWDFTFNDETPDIKDTSASTIFICGILELLNHVGEEDQHLYRKSIHNIFNSLYTHYSTKEDKQGVGLITDGMYHRTDGAEECTAWGDYFYVEAIVRNLKKWNSYW